MLTVVVRLTPSSALQTQPRLRAWHAGRKTIEETRKGALKSLGDATKLGSPGTAPLIGTLIGRASWLAC